MSIDCNRKNPLLRSASRQDQRALAALDTHYFDVDERSLADLIIFSQRYSQQIRFHDGSGADLDWLPFYDRDIIAILAGLSKVPVTLYRNFSSTLQSYLEDNKTLNNDELANHFKLCYHLPLILLKQVGDFYSRLPRDHSLKLKTQQLVQQDIENALGEVISFYKGGLAELPAEFDDNALQLVDYNIDFNNADSRIQLPSRITEQIDEANALSTVAIDADFVTLLGFNDWASFYAAVAADGTPYLDAAGDFYQQIYDALNYNLLTTSLDKLYQSIERLVNDAERLLKRSIKDSTLEHSPNYALWLSFLQLFEHNQQQINQLTDRHLNYYYQDILQICRKSAEADQAHLLLTLSKNKDDHLLEKGTLFKAGKDSEGLAVVYSLDEDIVLNRAGIAELRSTFLLEEDQQIIPYAAKQTNSLDGQGEDLNDEAPEWKPFGPVHNNSKACVGFAIADPQLFLKEGQRTITIEVTLSQPLTSTFSSLAFKVLLSAEEEWLEIDTYPAPTVGVTGGTNLKFVIVLDGDAPAIVPVDKDIHEGGFSTAYPMAKIEFNFSNIAVSKYGLFKDIYFETIRLSVAVSGIKDFSAFNENGVIDVSKPFLPYGNEPIKDSFLIIGSNEVLSKNIDVLKLHIDWEQLFVHSSQYLHVSKSSFKVSAQYLKHGQWHSSSALNNKPALNSTLTLNLPAHAKASLDQTLDNPQYSSRAKSGFIKLSLNKDFGHQRYRTELTSALIDKAAGNSNTEIDSSNHYNSLGTPKEPYTPSISSMSLSYNTNDHAPQQYFHLYPFGHKAETVSHGQLFPYLQNEGELYIGLENLDPAQSVSFLFETLEGSANPLKNENDLQWYYLVGNEWQQLEDRKVDDKTDNLSGTGIISIAIPEQADLQHDLLPSGLHWIRMSASDNSDALNDLLSIDTQAVSVTYSDQANAEDYLQTPLAANSIAKLQISDAAIKKIQQPNDSAGGRPTEKGAQYYTRVSERLRHKDRASTMWDYEHLVLEAFPGIYKVRCINHTQLCRDLANDIIADNEQQPGHVLVVPIPFVTQASNVDPLRPYTPKKTLVAIDKFLRKRTSPFVKLEVQNPKIEEVQFKFDIAFNDNIADISFYKDLLNTAIIEYLTPWTYEDGEEISFGGKWHKSVMINFIEEQHYVHYLKNVEMHHKPDISIDDAQWAQVNTETIEATTSRSILVSHANHVINEIIT